MGRPRKDAFDEATTTRVLRAAEEIFGRQGYPGARLEDIAADAGIRRSSLLYHFGKKENLYVEVVRRAFAELREAMEAGMAVGDSFEARLESTVRSLMLIERQHRPLLAVVLRELLNPEGAAREVVEAEFIPLVDRLDAFIELGRAAGIVPRALPVRAAIVMLVMGHLSRSAMGDRAESIWGPGEHTATLALALLVGHSGSADKSVLG